MKKVGTICLLMTAGLTVHAMNLAARSLAVDYPEPGINTEFGYAGHAPHNQSYTGQWGLDSSTGLPNGTTSSRPNCHECHDWSGASATGFRCENCHNNNSGSNYSAYSAPEMSIHSENALNNDVNGALSRGCGSCHTGTGYPWGGIEHQQQVDYNNPQNTPSLVDGKIINYIWTPYNPPNGLKAVLSQDINDPAGTYIIGDLNPPNYTFLYGDGAFDGCKLLPSGEMLYPDSSPYVWPVYRSRVSLSTYMWKIRFNGDPTVPYQNLPDNWFTVDPASGIVYDPTHYDLDPETLIIIRKDTNRPIDETLFNVNSVVVNDQDWNDINSWSKKTGEGRGLILQSLNASIRPYPIPDPLNPPLIRRSIYENEITDVWGNVGGSLSIVVKGQSWYDSFAYAATAVKTDFRIFYGQGITKSLQVDANTMERKTVVFLDPKDSAQNDGLGVEGIDSSPDGICQVCHTNTKFWRADGTGSAHFNGINCLGCHKHSQGFAVPEVLNCADCHYDYFSGNGLTPVHEVHLNASHGPQLAADFSYETLCLQCHVSHGNDAHAVPGRKQIAIGSCDNCHSPDGAYDGVNDSQVGALNNLDNEESTIYDTVGLLRPGKEEWCLTCHDDGNSSIHGVNAPNIAGKTISGGWQSPGAVVDTGFVAASDLIDGDTSTGNIDNCNEDLIFDMGSATEMSHIRIYTSGSKTSRWKVYGSNDLTNWDRILLGRKVRFSKTYWEIGAEEGWNEYRLDKFAPVQYIKLVKFQPIKVPTNNILEFQYKSKLSYGYMVNGHRMACDYCHDTKSVHIDANARTYTAAQSNYTFGYRLVDVVVGNETVPALEIPRVDKNDKEYARTSNDFALCFTCHDKGDLLGDAYGTGEFLKIPLQTDFRRDDNLDANGNQVNAHLKHLQGRGFRGNAADWDSDWDGVADSPQSCTACHNVHGSPNPAMTRHGELVSTPGTTDRVPMINFQYKNASGVVDPDISDLVESSGGATQYYGGGPGTISKNFTCKMCHNDQYSYDRTP